MLAWSADEFTSAAIADAALLCVHIILSTVFFTSGLAKLRDKDAARAAAEAFGVPHRLARVIGAALPVVEIAVGALVPLPWTQRFGATAACGLIAIFIVALVATVARGVEASCNCFGANTTRVTWTTVLRNLMLLALATFAAVGVDRAGALARWTWLPVGTRPIAAVLVPLVLALGAGYWLRRRARPPEYAQILDYSVETLDGEVVHLGSTLRRGLPVALMFLEPGCRQCAPLLADIAEWASWHTRLQVVVITPTGGHTAVAKFGALDVPVLVDTNLDVTLNLGVKKRPTAILIDRLGVSSAPQYGVADIRSLLAPMAGWATRH